MATSDPGKGAKKAGRKRPTPSSKPARRRGSPDDALTVRDVVRQYGGTPEQWGELVRSGRLKDYPHPSGGSRLIRRAQIDAYVARALARALDQDAPLGPGGTPAPVALRPRFTVSHKLIVFSGTNVPARDLERARRAGSTEAELRAAFPDLPAGAFEAIDALLRKSPRLARAWAKEGAPAETPPDDVDDDGEGFEEELEGLLDTHAGLFRRLAR